MLALAARRASRELSSSAQRKVSDTDSISCCSTEPPSGLRALCVPPCGSTCSADDAQHACAVITSSTSRICAASSASAAAASHAGPTPAMPQHKTSRLLSSAAARVRSLAAAFEATRTTSSSHKLTSSAAAAMQFEYFLDLEADAAVLVANRCVKQLTATWESLSVGGSAAGSECSSPSASFTCPQKPISRPITAGAPTANTYPRGSPFSTSPAGVSAAAVAAASKAGPDPAAAVRQCWRQESGQLGSIIRMLLPSAAEVGCAATAAAGGGSNTALALTLPQDSAPTQQVESEDWGSVACRAAVWAGLVSCA